jgi:hypothetical protein
MSTLGRLAAAGSAALLVTALLGPAANAGEEPELQVASVLPDGALGWSSDDYDVSTHGRFVLFGSAGFHYRRDLRQDSTRPLGLARRLDPRGEVLSGGGRYVAFWNTDPNPDGGGLVAQIHVHDVRRGTTRVVLRTTGEVGHLGELEGPVLAAGTRYVGFGTRDPGFAARDTNERRDGFVLDRRTGRVELVSATRRGRAGDGLSNGPALSADGRTAVFTSVATNLVPGDTNGRSDVFVRDLDADTTTRINVGDDGVQATEGASWATISADGSTVAWVAGGTVTVRDLATGTTTAVAPGIAPSLSDDGRHVAFNSSADVTGGPGCAGSAVYLHDRLEGSTTCLSPADEVEGGGSYGAVVTGDGAGVVFFSDAVLWPGLDHQGYVIAWRRDGVTP